MPASLKRVMVSSRLNQRGNTVLLLAEKSTWCSGQPQHLEITLVVSHSSNIPIYPITKYREAISQHSLQIAHFKWLMASGFLQLFLRGWFKENRFLPPKITLKIHPEFSSFGWQPFNLNYTLLGDPVLPFSSAISPGHIKKCPVPPYILRFSQNKYFFQLSLLIKTYMVLSFS